MYTAPGWLGSRAWQVPCQSSAGRPLVRESSRFRNAVLTSLAALMFWLGCAVTAQVARAGGGDDHSHGPEKPVVTTAYPRVAAQSENYDLVGILKEGRLALYLHRYANNEPVPDAAIAVTIGDETLNAELTPDGTYTVASSRFGGSGEVELVFAITEKKNDDLLIGKLMLPQKPPVAAAPAAPTPSLLERVKSIGQQRPNDLLPAVSAAFALGLFMGLLLRTRRLVPVAALTLLSVLALTSAAWPGGSDDHSHGPGGHGHGGGGQAPARLEDVPQRLPDGALFVPKPAQRLLEVRTTITKVETAQRGVALIGRVIADPNRSGLVQSINGGRVIAPEKGLPRIGQAVKRGEVLAQVEPALPQADRTTISERTGEIEQQIALAETKLNRIRPLAERGVVPQSQIIDIQTEIEGLKRRREIVGRTRVEPEVLRATIDGVIASAKVVAGQVVQGQDVLFQIVDPKGFWVEALVYGGINPAQITGASAAAADGTSLTLAPQGFSRALQEQASVVQFAVLNPASTLNVGQPVTVIAKSGAPVEGIILPREAVVRGANGVPQVWHHTDPERFEARSVLTEPFDATRVVVRGGLSPGERIVVRGAELINQIR